MEVPIRGLHRNDVEKLPTDGLAPLSFFGGGGCP